MVHPKETTTWLVCDFNRVGFVKFEIVKKIKAKSAEHRENSGTIQQKFHDSPTRVNLAGKVERRKSAGKSCAK
jgi:hypothetical protein